MSASVPADESRDAPRAPKPKSANCNTPDPIAEAQSSSKTDKPAREGRPRYEENGSNTTNDSIPADEASDMSTSDSDLTESSESENEMPPAKKIKTERLDRLSIPTDLTSTRETELVFKFISEQSDMTCFFPMAESNTSRALFTKARKFFQVFNKDIEVSILSCRLPFQQEQRCLFESSEGQFALLLSDVDGLKSSNQRLTIELKCVA